MMKRLWLQGVRYSFGLAAAAAILSPVAAHAQIRQVSSSEHRQAIGFTLGGFFPRGEDARAEGDILFTDLDTFAFELKDFTGGSIGGEWLFSLGDYLEGGVGVGFYQRTVPTIYRFFEDELTGGDIAQNLKLRIVPVTATVRFLPIGRGSAEPYVGVGLGAFNWRYSETGDFVAGDDTTFRGRFISKGTAVGPVVLAGIRAPFADVFDIGGEVQYQRATGDNDRADTGIPGEKMDLGGWHALLTMHIRF